MLSNSVPGTAGLSEGAANALGFVTVLHLHEPVNVKATRVTVRLFADEHESQVFPFQLGLKPTNNSAENPIDRLILLLGLCFDVIPQVQGKGEHRAALFHPSDTLLDFHCPRQITPDGWKTMGAKGRRSVEVPP